jgi:hypothetical protein
VSPLPQQHRMVSRKEKNKLKTREYYYNKAAPRGEIQCLLRPATPTGIFLSVLIL